MPISKEFLNEMEINNSSIVDLSNQYPYLNDKDIMELIEAIELKKINIKVLALSENNVGDAAASILYKLKNLEVLNVGTNCITDQGAKSIGRIKTLLDLDVSDNNISDEGLSEIINNLPKLKGLAFTSKSLGGKTINAILEHFNLEEVVIFDDENIDSKVLEQIEKHVKTNRMRNESNQTELNNNFNRLTLSSNKQPQFFQQNNQTNEDNKTNLVVKVPYEDEFMAELLKLDDASRNQYWDRFIERINNIDSYDNKAITK